MYKVFTLGKPSEDVLSCSAVQTGALHVGSDIAEQLEQMWALLRLSASPQKLHSKVTGGYSLLSYSWPAPVWLDYAT